MEQTIEQIKIANYSYVHAQTFVLLNCLDNMSTLANVQFTHTTRYEFDATTSRTAHSDVDFDLFIETCFFAFWPNHSLIQFFSKFLIYYSNVQNSNNSLNWFIEGGGGTMQS